MTTPFGNRLRSILCNAVCAALLVGCSGGGVPANGETGDDAGTPVATDMAQLPPDLIDNGQISTAYPANFPAPPQVITGGGPVLTNARIVPVFFAGDDTALTAQILDFDNKVGATDYWKTIGAEYGVRAATATAPVQLTETAADSLTDQAIQTWLAGKLKTSDPLWPVPDRNTVYSLHYPANTVITMQGGFMGGTSKSCQDFGGYHSNIEVTVPVNGKNTNMKVAYAVIPRCSDFGGLTGVDAITATESHELAEAATDPYPQSDPAYAQVDDDHLFWLFALGGGEVGDMCAQDPSSFTKFPELPYTVQRIWSNSAIMAGHDPCVPAPDPKTTPYFNAVPEQSDSITVGGMFTVMGTQVAVGSSVVIPVDLFSDGDTGGPFKVEAYDISKLIGGTATLGLTLDRTQGQNGEKLHLTIAARRASQYGASMFYLSTHLGGSTHYWFGLVGN